MIRLRPMRSDSAPKTTKNGIPSSKRDRDDVICRRAVHVKNCLQIEQRVKLAGVPNHALSRSRAEKRNQNALQVGPFRERFFQRLRRSHSRALDVLEDRRLLHAQPDVERNADQKNRNEKRNAPAPRAERFLTHEVLHDQNHGQRDEQAQRRCDLNEAGVEAALRIRHVFGNVNRRAAIFATERQSLQDANHQQNYRRGDSDRRVGRQETNQRSRAAHDQQRYEKRVLASDQIADASEEQRAERDAPQSRPRMSKDKRSARVCCFLGDRRAAR